MAGVRPYRFPPLARALAGQPGEAGEAASVQQQLAEGYRQGEETGFREGHAEGLARGHAEGHAAGYAAGEAAGREAILAGAREEIDRLAGPLEAVLASLQSAHADYHAVLRKEVVELVGKVARQVIRCELALQPVQLLALVDETLAAMPGRPADVRVYLNPEERERILELAPERAAQWKLLADPALPHGECRVSTDLADADAGCQQRLESCLEQVRSQLSEAP